MFRFAFPVLFLLIIILLIFLYRQLKFGIKKIDSLQIGSIESIRSLTHSYHYKFIVPVALRYIALVLLVFALARPQIGNVSRELTQKGIDIMLALDISGSMRAVDFKPNRLEASKIVAEEFVKGRKTDRIGLVVFGGESFLQCPLSIDYNVLTNIIKEISIVPEEYDGTAIGLAISNALNRLRDSDAKSKIIILLSDGANNSGDVDPLTAANFAKQYDVKIYTIAMGMDGKVMMPMQNSFFGGTQMVPVEMQVDVDLLNAIAETTNGKFFRANSEEKLKEIWQEISEMEKTSIKMAEYTDWDEKFIWFLLPALLLLAIEIILRRMFWSVYP